MKKAILFGATLAALSASSAFAQEGNGASTGMVGGAATGAIVGGPIGAGVGAVIGAVAGGVVDPPPERVVTYVQEQPLPAEPVVVERQVVVGEPLPETVIVTPVPENPRYGYTVVNQQRVIVDPQTRTVVRVIN